MWSCIGCPSTETVTAEVICSPPKAVEGWLTRVITKQPAITAAVIKLLQKLT